MTNLEVGDHVTFAGDHGEITKIEERPNGGDLLHVYTSESQLRNRSSGPWRTASDREVSHIDIALREYSVMRSSPTRIRTWVEAPRRLQDWPLPHGTVVDTDRRLRTSA